MLHSYTAPLGPSESEYRVTALCRSIRMRDIGIKYQFMSKVKICHANVSDYMKQKSSEWHMRDNERSRVCRSRQSGGRLDL